MDITEILKNPTFQGIVNPISIDTINTPIVFNSSATFYRTNLNTNIEIILPLGTDLLSNNVYTSSPVYLPVNTFNATVAATQISYPNNNSAQALINITCHHSLLIQYKLTKSDDTNFANQRILYSNLVNSANTPYTATVFANQQPDTGQHDNILINTYITHAVNDIIKSQFYIVQDSTNNDHSASKITIFRVSWVISS